MPATPLKPHLPSPRELLTSLFNSFPHEVQTSDSALPSNNTTNTTSNPLKALGARHRYLVITLHVLFPSIFLQALDLLDRGLVTRVTQVTPSAPVTQGPSIQPHQPHINLSNSEQDVASGEENQELSKNGNTFYLVRSAQTSHSHAHSRSVSSSSNKYGTAQGHTQGLSYIIRLHAWNCSCAAFAFSAFPGATSAPFSPIFEEDYLEEDPSNLSGVLASPPTKIEEEEEGEEQGINGRRELDWEFGGLSLNGKGSDREQLPVPCCKHLMACLLMEKLETVLGDYIKGVRVGKEEMAGLGVEAGM